MGEGRQIRRYRHMSDLFVLIAFWAFFPIGSLITAARLIGILWKNSRLTTARWHFDDLAEEGPGHEIYRLTLVSNRLTVYACVAGALLVVAGFIGVIGAAGLKLAAIAATVVLTLAVGRMRARHARLETDFERHAGEPLGVSSR